MFRFVSGFEKPGVLVSCQRNPRPLEHKLRFESTNPSGVFWILVFLGRNSSDCLPLERDFRSRIEEKLFQHFLRNLNINGTGAVIASPGDVPALSLWQQVCIDVAIASDFSHSNAHMLLWRRSRGFPWVSVLLHPPGAAAT